MDKTLQLSVTIDEEQADIFEAALGQVSDQFNTEITLCTLPDIPSKNDKAYLNFLLSELFADFGMPASLNGYQYLKAAICLVSNDSGYFHRGITSKLYPEIAAMFDSSAPAVERSIRHAIAVTWNNGDYNYLYDVFRNSISSRTGMPTNSDFIARVMELVNASSAGLEVLVRRHI